MGEDHIVTVIKNYFSSQKMARYNKHIRIGLIELMNKYPDQELEFTARFLARKNPTWITVSQLCHNEYKEVLARHLNLPVHKLNVDKEVLDTMTKGQKLILKAVISTYNTNGVTRATLKPADKPGVIQIEFFLD